MKKSKMNSDITPLDVKGVMLRNGKTKYEEERMLDFVFLFWGPVLMQILQSYEVIEGPYECTHQALKES